jgi:hypothetical protein
VGLTSGDKLPIDGILLLSIPDAGEIFLSPVRHIGLPPLSGIDKGRKEKGK